MNSKVLTTVVPTKVLLASTAFAVDRVAPWPGNVVMLVAGRLDRQTSRHAKSRVWTITL